MDVTIPDSYSVASGKTLYAGMFPPAPAWPTWRRALSPWDVYSIPNTALVSVEPADAQTQPLRGNTGPKSKIEAYVGAALRRSDSTYYVGPCGGHQDYYGNEMDALALEVEHPGWVELRAHSAVADIYNQVSVYADGRKAAQHTYWYSQVDELNNLLLICSQGGALAGLPAAPSGYPYPTNAAPFVTCGFDLTANDWLDPMAIGQMPYAPNTAGLCCQNPWTGEIFVNGDQKGYMTKYTPATKSWSTVGNWFLNGPYAAGGVDPKRNRMLVVGSFDGTRGPSLRSTINASLISATFGGLGASALTIGGYPGIIYDEVHDCWLVAYNNTTTGLIEILRVDCETLYVERVTLNGTLAARPNGINNSIQYVPRLKGFVIANSYTDNVKFVPTA